MRDYASLAAEAAPDLQSNNLIQVIPSASSQRSLGEFKVVPVGEDDVILAKRCALDFEIRLKQRQNVPKDSSTKLQQYPLVTNDDGSLLCVESPRCKAEFAEVNDLIRHLIECIMSLPSSVRACFFCDKRFANDRRIIDDHIRRHLPPALSCGICHFKGHTFKNMTDHVAKSARCREGLPTDPRKTMYGPALNAKIESGLKSQQAMYSRAKVPKLQFSHNNHRGKGQGDELKSSSDWASRVEPALRLDTSFACPHSACGRKFPTMGAVKQHMSIEHPILATCGVCQTKVSELDWDLHCQSHMPSVIDCNKCGDSMPASCFRDHQKYMCSATRQAMPDTTGNLWCFVCAEQFDNAQQFQEHQSLHVESSMVLDIANRVGIPMGFLEAIRVPQGILEAAQAQIKAPQVHTQPLQSSKLHNVKRQPEDVKQEEDVIDLTE